MKIPQAIRWDVSPAEAVQIQRESSARVVERDELGAIHYVAGVDVGFEGTDKHTARAAVVVLNFPALEPVDCAIARMPVTFPYIPGMLAFREAPVILKALEKLTIDPDVILVDGHGRAHPRRMGIACQLGLVLDFPTIGCAKSILVGKAAEPKQAVGAWTPLVDKGETVGAAVRTRAGVSPVYVTIGNKVTLDRAIKVVLQCCKGYRLPETTRYAHRVAGGDEISLNSGQKGCADGNRSKDSTGGQSH